MEEKFTFKQRLFFSSMVSLFLTFTLTFFGPLNLYILGSNDLWFTIKAAIVPVIITFVISFVILSLLLSLPKKTFHKILCCLVFGIALASYIQYTYLSISYGKGGLNGNAINWNDYIGYGILDTAIWIACIALPVLLMVFVKKYYRTILIGASICFILIQTITLITVYIQNHDTIYKTTYTSTSEGMFELSEKDNTLVFILDAFDQKYYDHVKKEHPEYMDKLEGFTEYDNCITTGSRTIEAFPSMMTGKVYKKDCPYADYIEKIWDEDIAFKKLKENKVDSRIFAETIYFGYGATNRISNIKNQEEKGSSYFKLGETLYKYTMFSYAPHFAKKLFWLDTSEFNHSLPENVYTPGDDKFYKSYLDHEGYKYTKNYDKAIRIYSLNGAHTPYKLKKDSTISKNGTSLYEQIDGCFNYLFRIFSDMKKDNKYKDTTIIITADHGDIDLIQHPILLIKNKGEDKNYKKISSPVSHFDLLPTLASISEKDVSKFGSGKTYFDYKENEIRKRYYYFNTGANSKTCVQEYVTTSNAYNDKAMKLIHTYYTNDGKVEKYTLDTKLSFGMDATANVYCTEGFRHTTGWRTPLAGPHSQMVIPLDSIPDGTNNLNCTFYIEKVDTPSNCVIKANGQEVYTNYMDKSITHHNLSVKVPRNLIKTDNKLTLDFYFTDIKESELSKETNKRSMTISFRDFVISAE